MVSIRISQCSPEKQDQEEINNDKEICHEELAHAIVEAVKSRDPQGEMATWGLRRAEGVSLSLRPFEPGELIM